jgi:hypothetical protein
MSTKAVMQEWYRKEAQAPSASENAQVASRRSAAMKRAWVNGAGYSWEEQRGITNASLLHTTCVKIRMPIPGPCTSNNFATSSLRRKT